MGNHCSVDKPEQLHRALRERHRRPADAKPPAACDCLPRARARMGCQRSGRRSHPLCERSANMASRRTRSKTSHPCSGRRIPSAASGWESRPNARPVSCSTTRPGRASLGLNTSPKHPVEFRQQACRAHQSMLTDNDRTNDGQGGWLVDTNATTFVSWMMAFGGGVLEGNSYRFLTPKNLAALTFVKQAVRRGLRLDRAAGCRSASRLCGTQGVVRDGQPRRTAGLLARHGRCGQCG